MERTLEQRTISKASWRLLPLIVVIYFVAYMDRTNVSFASLSMNKDLGFTATLYGWGAGIFFIGYFLFEVPSNIILEKTGARLWIARIMITWGICAAIMAFIKGPVSFLILRFLLGVAEAGFFPGMILYFTYWFPSKYRARVLSALYIAVPGANALTAIVSGALLSLDGTFGLRGWQWLYIVEAVPAILLAFAVLAWMTDRPSKAKWLEPEERDWLESVIEEERKSKVKAHGEFTLFQALTNPTVLLLATIYFTIVTATYGITFFLPAILKSLGLTDFGTGIATAIPYTIGTIGMLVWSWSSDRHNERRLHFVVAALLATIGLIAVGLTSGSYLAILAMSFAAVGLYGSKPAFWPLPSTFLTGAAAAGGIALVNAIGNLGGFVGPYAVGWIKDTTGSFEAGLYFLAAFALISAILVFFTLRPSAVAERTAAVEPAE
jgi:ACS family tartrate transporter-like MFS transporter